MISCNVLSCCSSKWSYINYGELHCDFASQDCSLSNDKLQLVFLRICSVMRPKWSSFCDKFWRRNIFQEELTDILEHLYCALLCSLVSKWPHCGLRYKTSTLWRCKKKAMDNVNGLKTLGLLFLGQAKNKIKMSQNSTIHGITAVSGMRYPVLTSHGSLLFISPRLSNGEDRWTGNVR